MKKVIVLVVISVLQLWAKSSEDCGCTCPRPPIEYMDKFPDETLRGQRETFILNFCSYIGNRDHEGFKRTMPSFFNTLKNYTGYCYRMSDPVIQSTFICGGKQRLNMLTYAIVRNRATLIGGYLLREHKIDVNGLDPDDCNAKDVIRLRRVSFISHFNKSLYDLQKNGTEKDLNYQMLGKTDNLLRTYQSIKMYSGYESYLNAWHAKATNNCQRKLKIAEIKGVDYTLLQLIDINIRSLQDKNSFLQRNKNRFQGFYDREPILKSLGDGYIMDLELLIEILKKQKIYVNSFNQEFLL